MLSVPWGCAPAVTALCTVPHTALLKPGAPVGMLWWGAHGAMILGTLLCGHPWHCVTWVWSSLWLVPIAGGRWLPSSCTHCFATDTVESLQQIHSQQNPKLISLHQGWTWPFILNSSKGKRLDKNMSIFLTIDVWLCKYLSSDRRIPHPSVLSAVGFKLAIYLFTGGTSLVSCRGRMENSKIKDHDLAMPPG